MRRQISEAQLRNIVHDVIMEEVEAQALEEGLWGGASTLFNRGKNKAQMSTQNLSDKIGDYAREKYTQAKKNIQNAYGQAKRTYQAGSINQDLQKYVNDAETALNNLKNANQRALDSGFGALLNKNVLPLIDQLLKNLNRVRGQGKSLRSNMQNVDLQI